MKKALSAALLILFAISSTCAQKTEVFAPDGKAIKGYDPVAFFKESKPVMGKDGLSYQWKGVTWLFSTPENLKSFKANPEKCAPQYGGYCAYGAAQGKKAPTETGTWTILNGKLYFNYNEKVQELWMKDQNVFIEKADQKWNEIKDKE